MGDMKIEHLRSRFESAWREKWPDDSSSIHNRDRSGKYVQPIVEDSWIGFQVGYVAALMDAAGHAQRTGELLRKFDEDAGMLLCSLADDFRIKAKGEE